MGKGYLVLALLGGIIVSFIVCHLYFINTLNQEYEFGDLVGRRSVEHTFTIPNFSLNALEVQRISSSCGCTVVEDLPKSVAPLHILSVPIRINLTQATGPMEQQVTVIFRDQSTANFSLKASVFPSLPDKVQMDRFLKGAAIKKQYALLGGMDWTEGFTFSAPDGVDLEILKRGETSLLQVEIKPAFSETGSFDIPINIQCKELDAPTVFRLVGYVEREVEISSDTISLGYVRSDGDASTAKSALEFYSPYKLPFRWERSRTEHSPAIALTEEPDGKISASIAGSIPPGLYSERVVFTFKVSEQEEILLPVTLQAYKMEI